MEFDALKDTVDNLKENDAVDCIGITFTGDKAEETKIYYYEKKNKKSADIENFEVANNADNDRKYFRVIQNKDKEYPEIIDKFKRENGITDEIIVASALYELCKIASEYGDQTRLRLSLLGIQKFNSGRKVIKSYFSLRKFMSRMDVRGIKQSFKEMQDIFEKIQESCMLNSNYNEMLKALSEFLEKQEYYPSMIGLNQEGDKLEFKLYFELFSTNKFWGNIKNHTMRTIKYICDYFDIQEEEYYEVNKIFIENGYFLRGVAISNRCDEKKSIKLRLYYFPTYRFT